MSRAKIGPHEHHGRITSELGISESIGNTLPTITAEILKDTECPGDSLRSIWNKDELSDLEAFVCAFLLGRMVSDMVRAEDQILNALGVSKSESEDSPSDYTG